MTLSPERFELASATEILRREYWLWLPVALLSLVAASLLLSGWPAGLIPNLTYPYNYDGDSLFHLWMAQRLIEGGWLFENPRSGFPFGSNFLDYPGSDAANHFIIKLLGFVTGTAHGALNLFYLISFPAIFVSTYVVTRAFGLGRAFAVCAGVLFAMQSFHFLRLPHIFFAAYFVVPLYFYVGARIYFADSIEQLKRPRAIIRTGVLVAVLACFGVYYAIFGTAILLTAGFAAWVRHGDARWMIPATGAALAIGVAIAANIAPNVFHRLQTVPNPEVAIRHVSESETYGLKLVQLLLPRQTHRIRYLREITQSYNDSHPLVNENSTASLGAIGACGFLILGICLLRKLSGGSIDDRLAFLALITLMLFMLGTVGGFGSVFASAISPIIRAWNRVSIFIAFASLLAFFLVLELIARRYKQRAGVFCAIAAAIGVFGFFDQTVATCRACNERTRAAFELDRDFIQKIEQILPANAAIYQLPYLPFPEAPPLHRLEAYELLTGFLHATTLRWSFAGMKGREGDRFFKDLAQKPVSEQIEIAVQKGFSGIYVDRRGYDDGAKKLLQQLTSLLDKPSVSRADGEIIFFAFSSRDAGRR